MLENLTLHKLIDHDGVDAHVLDEGDRDARRPFSELPFGNR
jgi:hypothetical protein